MAKRLICIAAVALFLISCVIVPVSAFNATDYNNYKTLNALPTPYAPVTGVMANYVSYDEGEIRFAGVYEGGFSENRSCFILTDWQTGSVSTQVLTFSTNLRNGVNDFFDSRVLVRLQIVSSVGGYTYYDCSPRNDSVTFEMAPSDKLNIYIRFASGLVIPQFSFYPVLNFGDIAYPYQPYMNSILDQYYSNGEAAGQQQGFDEGVVEGLNRAENIKETPYTDVSVDIKFVVDGNIVATAESVPFDRTYEGIYFRNVTDDYLYAHGYGTMLEDCDFAYVVVRFNNPSVYQTTPYMIVGSELISDGIMYISPDALASTASRYEARANSDVYGVPRTFTLVDGSPTANPGYVTSLWVHVGRPVDLLREFTLYSPSGSYESGYLEGYKSGISDSESDAFDRGYEEGEKAGYSEGKKDGLSAADSGDWLSLFTAVVEAPVNAFQSLFNFEIFGFDMKLMISSILTICMFITILKKFGVI